MEVIIRRLIDQPIDRVFAHYADIEQRPVWLTTAVERVKLTGGPVGVGSRLLSTSQMPTGKQVQFNQEVTGYAQNERLAESWDGPFAGKIVATFESRNGTTQMTLRMEMSPPGLLGIIAPFAKPKIKRDLEKDLNTFENWVADTS